MKKLLSICLVLVSCFMFLVTPSKADEEVRKMTLDVKLKGFTQSEFKDNLESKDIIFAPNDKLELQLKIKNEGNRNQTNIKVIPKISGPFTIDTNGFVLNQITPGETYTRNITVTVKDKQFVNRALTANTIRFDLKTDVGTETGDYGTFYTSNGTKAPAATATSSATPTLPATGANIFLGTSIASILGFVALKSRKAIRGY